MQKLIDENRIKQKIKALRKEKKLSQEAFAEKFGETRGSLQGIESGRTKITIDLINKVSQAYDVDPDYFFSASSKSKKDDTSSSPDDPNEELIKYNKLEKNVKYIPHPVQAGLMKGFAEINGSSMNIHVPGFEGKGECYAFPVENDSMSPLISSGDILIVKEVKEKVMVNYGSVYVIDWEHGIMVKRIRKGKKLDLVLLSDNENYDPYDVNFEQIHRLYVVLGFISRNTSPRVVHLSKY